MSLLQKAAQFKIKERDFPWLLLGVALLAYGVMIQDLGFYWDDWEILYLSSAAKTPETFSCSPSVRCMSCWILPLSGRLDLIHFPGTC